MAVPFDPSIPPSSHIEIADESTFVSFDVHGNAADRQLPVAMSGRLVGAHGGVVHSVQVRAGQVLSYRSLQVPAHVGADSATSDIVVFGDSLFAYGRGSLAEELSEHLDRSRPVDLAGHSQGLSACPKHDPITGDLHLLALAADGVQAHVVVSSGALTRRRRPILGSPNEVGDLGITRDHVLFLSDGFVGVTSRDSEARIIWIATGVDAPVLAHAHDVAGAIVMHILTPSLERWTLNIGVRTIQRTVLDQARLRSARSSDLPIDGAPRFLCTIGDGTADTHDLATGSHTHRSFGTSQPGGLAFVADPSRPGDARGGWLVGFVHEATGARNDLVVLDAADISRPTVASVHIPRRIPPGLRTTWIPETTSNHPQGDRP